MVLTIGGLYREVGTKFKISHKVLLFIRNLFMNEIMKTYKLIEKEKDTFLHLTHTTSKLQKKVEIELKIDKDSMVYYIKLPYEEIAKHEDQREAFLKYYFDGLVMVFKEFGVWEEHIREVEKKVKEEVLNNDEYKYVDKIIRIDPSKFDF